MAAARGRTNSPSSTPRCPYTSSGSVETPPQPAIATRHIAASNQLQVEVCTRKGCLICLEGMARAPSGLVSRLGYHHPAALTTSPRFAHLLGATIVGDSLRESLALAERVHHIRQRRYAGGGAGTSLFGGRSSKL